MSISLYRNCKIGETLKETLREMTNDNKIPEKLSDTVLNIFDSVMCDELSKFKNNRHSSRSTCTIKGNVKSYKHCDDIWIFTVDNVYLRTESENFQTEKLKIVACDNDMKKKYQNHH
jgi:transcription initiation factor TFIIA small subunit